MTTKELIAKAIELGITSGYDYPGFDGLCRSDRQSLVMHFAEPVAAKTIPVPSLELQQADETTDQWLDRTCPIDDMPHRFSVKGE